MTVTSLDHHMALRAVANGKTPPNLHDELFVGRETELALSDRDLDLIEAGGASLRILVGEPGGGKTMLMQSLAARARGRRFLTANADLDPDCLFHGRGGEGRSLVRKTVLGMRTSTSGDQSVIDAVIGRFGNDCRTEAETTGQLPRDFMRERLVELNKQPKGSEFAKVIQTFALARENSQVAANARRWLCGEYASSADARDELGTSTIIEEQDFWPMQKLWASFSRLAGRPGYVLFIDEARVICDLHPNVRSLNLEQLLMIFNDILQGRAAGIGVVIAATPSFITQWNGMAKHEGLSSCLQHQKDQLDLHEDIKNVLVRLPDFADAELLELLRRCHQLCATCHPGAPSLPDEALDAFLETCRNQIGEARWHVPRVILQRFVAFQDRLTASPNSDWRELLAGQSNQTDNSEMGFEDYAHRQM